MTKMKYTKHKVVKIPQKTRLSDEAVFPLKKSFFKLYDIAWHWGSLSPETVIIYFTADFVCELLTEFRKLKKLLNKI